MDDAFAVEPALLIDVLAALSAQDETMSAAQILKAALVSMEIIEADASEEGSLPESSEVQRAATMPLPSLPSDLITSGEVTQPLDLELEPELGLVESGTDSTSSTQADAAFDSTLAELADIYESDDDELPPLASRRIPAAEEVLDPAVAAARLDAALGTAEIESERAVIALELAELTRDRLHDPDAAVSIFEQALEFARPGDDVWDEANEALGDLFAIREDWPNLLDVYERRLSIPDVDKSSVHLQRASVLNTMERFEDARTACELALPSGDRARELLVTILERLEDWDAIVELLLTEISDLGKRDQAYRHWRAADILREPQPELALLHLRQSAQLLDDEELGREFIALARSVGSNEDQCEALCYQADLLGNTTSAAVRRSSLLLEAARLLADGDDLSRVRLLLEDSLASWPENVDAVVALGRCLEQLGDADALFDLLEIEMKLLLPGTRRGLTALRLADLGMQLERGQDAVDHYLSIAHGDLEGTSFEERLPTQGTMERKRPSHRCGCVRQTAHELFDGGQDVSAIVNILEDALSRLYASGCLSAACRSLSDNFDDS